MKFIFFQKGCGVQPAIFQLFYPPLNRMWTMWTLSLFFGDLRTAAILSTWIVWPHLDALMPLAGPHSVRITSITQVFSIPYAITVM
jgi:hypothetical protein